MKTELAKGAIPPMLDGGWTNDCAVNVMLGHTLREVKREAESLRFTLTTGEVFRMWHRQDCCEDVVLDDIAGELGDLVGSPLTMAEEVNSEPPKAEREYPPDSETWTFYKFATVKGYVTLRWHGTSNGYYSEEVDFARIS